MEPEDLSARHKGLSREWDEPATEYRPTERAIPQGHMAKTLSAPNGLYRLSMAKAVENQYLKVGALVFAAFLLRLLFLRTAWVLDPDSVYYCWLGRALLSGDLHHGLSAYWSPFYPLLVGTGWRLLGDLELAGRMVSVIAGSLVVIPTYFLARQFYGNRAATISAVLVSFYPPLLHSSTLALTEAVYGLILMTLIWLLWKGVKEPSTHRFIGAGLLVGLAYLTKPEGILYLLVVFLTLVGLRVSSRPFDLKLKLRAALVIVAAVLVVSFPYLVYLREVTGVWIISQKANAAFTVPAHRTDWSTLRDDDGTLMDSLYASGKVRVQQVSIFRKALDNYPDVIRNTIRRAHQFYIKPFPMLFPPLLIALAGLGLFYAPWTRQRWYQELYFALFIVATTLTYSLTQFSPRYMVPALPLLLIWAAIGVQSLADWALRSLPRLFAGRCAVLQQAGVASGVIVAVLSVSLLPELTYPWRNGKWDQPIEQKIAATWIETNGPPQPVIMATGPWAAFYAEGRHLYIPRGSYDKVISYARRKKVTYVIVDGRWIDSFNADLRFLLQVDAASKDLAPVYRVDENPEYPLVVYRMRNGEYR